MRLHLFRFARLHERGSASQPGAATSGISTSTSKVDRYFRLVDTHWCQVTQEHRAGTRLEELTAVHLPDQLCCP